MKLANVLKHGVAFFVITIVLLMIIPLPPGVLDFMFILQFGIALIILVTTMYIKESLDFSIFPSILLITTLFRLGLNISSTRSILSSEDPPAYAGEIVQTFGQFVIKGDPVVGAVVFIIIVLVNLIVITAGSGRVAEVAARFTLDAMPGKQMAIDADLSAGYITDEEAKLRREKVQREAAFFGAMDGACKFVKGDATMSIVVTLINFIGGVIVGFIRDVGSFGEIANLYTVATIGDGLVSSVPALLISVATGMIVSRSASQANLSTDVINQFKSTPVVLIIAGITLLFMMFIGFPLFQTIMVAGVFLFLGIMLMRNNAQLQTAGAAAVDAPETVQEITSEAEFYRNVDNLYGLLTVEQIRVEFGYSLIPLVDDRSGGHFLDRVVIFRKQFAQEMGFVVPPVQLKDSGNLNPNQYCICIKGEVVSEGDILVDHYLGLAPPEGDTIDGIETIEPAFGIKAKWISEDKKMKAELLGYTLIDPTSVIITHLSEIIRTHAFELLSRLEVNNMLENLKKTNATIVADTVPSILSVSELQKVLAMLLKEGVPIKDLETILETLGDYAGKIKDTDMLTEYVRQALKRTISHRFSEAGQLKVLSLDADIENLIMNSVKKIDSGSYLALDQSIMQKIIVSSTQEIDKIKDLVAVPIVLTSPVVRVYFKKLIDQFYPNVAVLSYNEIDTRVQIQALGNISI
ncbi:MAG: flagellar biosynthesis protein FlhA [Oscillospiraceae bacterium]|nr:flagellar biosynthesis protein FlhA [Oscillospiraceae bacterium]